MLRILIIGVAVAALASAYPQPSKTDNLLNFLSKKEDNKKDNKPNPVKCELCEEHDKEMRQKEIEDLDKKIQSINDRIKRLESNKTELNDKIDVLLTNLTDINHHQFNLPKEIESFQKEFEASYKHLFELEYNAIKLKNDVIYMEYMIFPLNTDYETKENSFEVSKLKIHQWKEQINALKSELDKFYKICKQFCKTLSAEETSINNLKNKISPITTKLALEIRNMELITKKFNKIKSKISFNQRSDVIKGEKQILQNDINSVEDNLNVVVKNIFTLENGINTTTDAITLAGQDIEDNNKTFNSIRNSIENILNQSKNLEQELKDEKTALELKSNKNLGMENPTKRLEITSNYGEMYVLSKILYLENKVISLEPELKSQIEEIKRDGKIEDMEMKFSNGEAIKDINLKLQEIEKQLNKLESKIISATGAQDSTERFENI